MLQSKAFALFSLHHHHIYFAVNASLLYSLFLCAFDTNTDTHSWEAATMITLAAMLLADAWKVTSFVTPLYSRQHRSGGSSFRFLFQILSLHFSPLLSLLDCWLVRERVVKASKYVYTFYNVAHHYSLLTRWLSR